MTTAAKATLQAPAVAGAEVNPSGVTYRVWAPDESRMSVWVERDEAFRQLALFPAGNGYWQAKDPAGRAGDLYLFELTDGRKRPDVCSRFQPQGVDGPSECIDPSAYSWQCPSWIRPRWTGQSIYELHVGTFTDEGGYAGAIAKLDHVRELGVEAVEIMPLADFAGERNWGYDGVALYAPARCYGRPDELRALVDAAHELGLAVILDVVYNHVGPAGNHLADYCANYFRRDQENSWGAGFDLDGPRSQAVRDFLVGNALYWLDEFRFDGLRLDATHAIPDRSERHLLEEIAGAVHARGGFLIAEDERNEAGILRSSAGQSTGFDAVWADDFHHQVRVALTGIRSSYFSGYQGTAADLATTLAHGWMYRGQPFEPWAGRNRGSDCAHLPARAFVACIENHDQIGNRARGERLEKLVTPRQFRAASALLCLGPYVPLLFMGQEWAASTPFLFFTDHGGELGERISRDRRREFSRHGGDWKAADLPDPENHFTFLSSKLRWSENEQAPHAGILAFYRECLRQRRAALSPAVLRRDRWRVHHIGDYVAIRYQLADSARLLLVALREGAFPSDSLPPDLRPPAGKQWRAVLHSEDERFGGTGCRHPSDGLQITGPAAVWLETVPEENNHGPC